MAKVIEYQPIDDIEEAKETQHILKRFSVTYQLRGHLITLVGLLYLRNLISLNIDEKI